MKRQPRTDEGRLTALFSRVTPGYGGCWIWTGPRTNGYGITSHMKRALRAHRVAYELTRGPIPKGLHLDHLCRVRACIRPDHLEAVTQAENNRRMGLAYLKCPSGHDLPPREPGKRRKQCAACKRDYDRQRYLELGPRSGRGTS